MQLLLLLLVVVVVVVVVDDDEGAFTLCTTSYDVVRPVYDVVRPRVYYVCRLMHTNNKMATKDDVYDVVLASSSLRVWRIYSSSKLTNSTSTLLGSRRAASSR